MDQETRNEINDLRKSVLELKALIRSLQALAGYHDDDIKALQQPLRDPNRVHP